GCGGHRGGGRLAASAHAPAAGNQAAARTSGQDQHSREQPAAQRTVSHRYLIKLEWQGRPEYCKKPPDSARMTALCGGTVHKMPENVPKLPRIASARLSAQSGNTRTAAARGRAA